MKRLISFYFVAIVVFSLIATRSLCIATPIGSASYSPFASSDITVNNPVLLDVAIGALNEGDFGGTGGGWTLFSLFISPDSVGMIYNADPPYTPDADLFAIDSMTDSMPDYIGWRTGGADFDWDGGHFDYPHTSPWQFYEDYNGNGIDFAGYNITDISLTIDEMPTPRLFNISVTVHGYPVPEPSITIIVFSCILGILGLRNKFTGKSR